MKKSKPPGAKRPSQRVESQSPPPGQPSKSEQLRPQKTKVPAIVNQKTGINQNRSTSINPSTEPNRNPPTSINPSTEPNRNLPASVNPSTEQNRNPPASVNPSTEPSQNPPAAVNPSTEPKTPTFLCSPHIFPPPEHRDRMNRGRSSQMCRCKSGPSSSLPVISPLTRAAACSRPFFRWACREADERRVRQTTLTRQPF